MTGCYIYGQLDRPQPSESKRCHIRNVQCIFLFIRINWADLEREFAALPAHYDHVLGVRPTGWTHQTGASPADSLAAIRTITRGRVSLLEVPYSEHSSFSELKRCSFSSLLLTNLFKILPCFYWFFFALRDSLFLVNKKCVLSQKNHIFQNEGFLLSLTFNYLYLSASSARNKCFIRTKVFVSWGCTINTRIVRLSYLAINILTQESYGIGMTYEDSIFRYRYCYYSKVDCICFINLDLWNFCGSSPANKFFPLLISGKHLNIVYWY
jgi:hypothetical protein